MSFPIPPTDNLYKFLAITGLLMILSTQFLYWSASREFWEKAFEIDASLAALQIDVSRLKLDSLELRVEIERTKDAAKLERLREREKQNAERLDAHEARLAASEAKRNLLNVLADRFQLIRALMIAGCGLGSLLAVAGFYLWYTRIQVYQDRALRQSKGK